MVIHASPSAAAASDLNELRAMTPQERLNRLLAMQQAHRERLGVNSIADDRTRRSMRSTTETMPRTISETTDEYSARWMNLANWSTASLRQNAIVARAP